MKTLIIHPQDPSTDFLRKVYEGLPDTTLITNGCVGAAGLADLIEDHDRVIALGHGTPNGLLGSGQFGGELYALDKRHAKLLKKGINNIYIWCNADQFVQHHNLLSDIYSGMFISEVGEAHIMGLYNVYQDHVDNSNKLFTEALNGELIEGGDYLCDGVIHRYTNRTLTGFKNEVSDYNADRLYER